ncbi:UNVERIFIED_CONTAM: hypothetical protein GTU68_040286 [Idotea baltica]|nr:hypothetical protein [Idotea baltica]
MSKYNLTVNNKSYEIDVSDDTPILWILRDHLNLLGTKFGCGIGQCGACTIHINGEPARSCSMPVSLIADKKITTIEGISENGDHPVQLAWKEIDVPQCGYCQAGQIMTATAFLEKNPSPNNEEIREAMNGNICRCASYNRIENAVAKAATTNS